MIYSRASHPGRRVDRPGRVLANGGHAHAVTHFAVFGYHVTGSTGTLFLYGIVVGALALAGLSVLLAAPPHLPPWPRRPPRAGAVPPRNRRRQRGPRRPAWPARRRPRLYGQRRTTELHRQHAGMTEQPRTALPRTALPRTAPIRACAGLACSRACSRADPLPRRLTRSQTRWPARLPPHSRSPADQRPRSQPRPRPRSDSPVTGSSRHVPPRRLNPGGQDRR